MYLGWPRGCWTKKRYEWQGDSILKTLTQSESDSVVCKSLKSEQGSILEMWKNDSLWNCFVFCKLKKFKIHTTEFEIVRAPYCVWKKGEQNRRWKCEVKMSVVTKCPPKGLSNFQPTSPQEIFFSSFLYCWSLYTQIYSQMRKNPNQN